MVYKKTERSIQKNPTVKNPTVAQSKNNMFVTLPFLFRFSIYEDAGDKVTKQDFLLSDDQGIPRISPRSGMVENRGVMSEIPMITLSNNVV